MVYQRTMIHPLKTLSRGDLVASLLKGAILTGEYRPGETLVEREIAARFGTSKTPVREALRSLAASRLIVMMGHKAAYVQPLDRATISDVFELRGQIEPWAVASAIDNIGPQQISKIEMELNASIEAVNREDWLAAINAAREFHRLSYEQCRNKIARDVLDNLQEIMLFITVNLWSYKPTWRKETEEHGKIVEALKRKDRDLVRDALSRHIADARDNVMEMLEARKSPEMIRVEEEV